MKLCGVQFGFSAADLEDEVAQDLRALRRVMNLGMKLHGIPLLRRILDRGHRIRCLADQLEARRQLQRLVAVRHPHRQRTLQAFEQRRVVAQQLNLRVAVLALVGGADFAAQLVHHELQAVADAQHRQSKMQDALVGRRRVGVIDGRRPARQHDARRRIALDLVERCGAGQHDGEDVLFADAARDELRILRAKVEDDDRLRFHHLLCQRTPAV